MQNILVIGGGLAGLTCAVSAAEAGAQVTLLEAGRERAYPANSRFAGGLFHVAMQDITSPAEALLAAITQATGGHADPALARALAGDAAGLIHWLAAHGIAFEPPGDAPYEARRLAPFRFPAGAFARHWPGACGDRLLEVLELALLLAGGRLLRGQRAQDLILDDNGRIAGVETRDALGGHRRFAADAVLLADGGFAGDPALMRQEIGPRPDLLCQRGAGSGRGDGLRMALAAGAAVTHGDGFYGHLQCAEALHDDRFWPYPVLDLLAATAVVVDASGRRFTDEGGGGLRIANAIAALPDPLSATLILDDAIWSGPGAAFLVPPNPALAQRGARIDSAPTLAALAGCLGLAPLHLAATVTRHNAACERGDWAALTPPRSTATGGFTARPAPIRQPPFHAIRLCAGVTYTLGGILIDADARVLRPDRRPIPGLFAAGASTGGLEGGPLNGYVGGLAKAGVFGLRAARAMLADRGGADAGLTVRPNVANR